MNDKKVYLGLGIIFTVMSIAAEAWPVFIIGAIYFYVFFTHDEREREKELAREKRSRQWEKERIEKEKIDKIKEEKRKIELEKIRVERLRKEREEEKEAIARRNFSYVYVLGNESMPGIIKIGYTDKEPSLRAAEISSSTGVPTPFSVLKEYAFATLNKAQQEEKRLHSVFEQHRVNTNREFFKLGVDQVNRQIRNNIRI